MAEFQNLLDFPPAPKLDSSASSIPSKATEAELRGEGALLRQGAVRDLPHRPLLHRQPDAQPQVERFFKEKMINGRKASADGPIKTFPLRGIKDSPPYLHDDRLLTLEDTVEFFNLVLGTKLTAEEKADLVAFLRCL